MTQSKLFDPRATSLVAAASLFVALGGCRMSIPPDPAQGLGPTAQVVAPVVGDDIGELFATEDGIWAFKTEPARSRDYEPGQLVAFGDVDETSRHLFAVLSTHAWGVALQRLDAAPVETPTSGSLIPLSSLDEPTAERWGFCVGVGAPDGQKCIRNSAPGTRWRLYSTDGSTLSIDGGPGDAFLPVALRGVVTTSSLGIDVVTAGLPDAWVAVKDNASPRPTQPRIAWHPDCADAPGVDDLGARWFAARFEAPKDLVDVSATAYDTGTDAMVWCDETSTWIGTPALFRPRNPVAGRDFAMPSLFGRRPVRLRGPDRQHAALLARVGAAIATGDYASADLFLEHLMRTAEKSRQLDDVAVRSMDAVALGGRPEAAARLGRYATRLSWNPENSPAWVVGMAALEAQLGNKQSAVTRTQALTDLLERSEDGSRAFVLYFDTLARIGGRAAASDNLEMLQDYPRLELLARTSILRSSDELEALRSEFESNGMLPLHRALVGDVAGLKCANAGRCVSDSYGRLWASGLVAPAGLSRVHPIELRPGFDLDNLPTTEGIDTLRHITAVYPLLPSDQHPNAVTLATDAAVDWARKSCLGGAKSDALDPLIREGIDSALRMEDWRTHPLDATMAWLAIRGIPATCSSTEELVVRAAELAENIGSTSAPAELIALHVETTPDERLESALNLAAEYALRHERAEKCLLWTTALAGGYAEAGHLEVAQEWTKQAARCDYAQRRDIDFVSAYLSFQRSGDISGDFAREIRVGLATALRTRIRADEKACIGALPLNYNLLEFLTGSVAQLAMRLPIQEQTQPEELSVVTASDRMLIAREHISDALRHVDARAWADAARSLGFARDTFVALGHQPGIARASWLDQALFDGRAAEVAAGELEFKRLDERAYRKKTLSELVAAGEATVEQRVARQLLTTFDELLEPIASPLPAREVLCAPRNPEPRGTVLDRRDGTLRRTTPNDEPEVTPVTPGSVGDEL